MDAEGEDDPGFDDTTLRGVPDLAGILPCSLQSQLQMPEPIASNTSDARHSQLAAPVFCNTPGFDDALASIELFSNLTFSADLAQSTLPPADENPRMRTQPQYGFNTHNNRQQTYYPSQAFYTPASDGIPFLNAPADGSSMLYASSEPDLPAMQAFSEEHPEELWSDTQVTVPWHSTSGRHVAPNAQDRAPSYNLSGTNPRPPPPPPTGFAYAPVHSAQSSDNQEVYRRLCTGSVIVRQHPYT